MPVARRRRFLLPVLTAVTCLLASTGCDSDRLAEFNAFSSAGSAYVATFRAFTASAASALIADSSTKLITGRAFATPTPATAPDLAASVTQEDTNLRGILASLQLFDHHAALLGSYFSALADLGGSKAPDAVAASLTGLADAIGTLNPQMEKISLGSGTTVKSAIGPVSTLVIGHFQAKALDRALAHDAPIIDQALALQQAAVEVLSTTLRTIAIANLAGQEQDTVIAPYIAPNPLPPNWAASRDAYLRASATVSAADDATVAITALRSAFKTLVTEPKAHLDLKSLFNSISHMASATAAGPKP